MPGPGYYPFSDWAASLITGSPSKINSITLSPTGFPLLHWYPGTGFFFALPKIISFNAIDYSISSKIAHLVFLVSTLILISCFFYNFTKKNIPLSILGLGILLTGTNSGYYFVLMGSELFCFFIITFSYYLAVRSSNLNLMSFILIGTLIGLQFTVRPQASILMMPAIFTIFFNLFKNSGKSNLIKNLVLFLLFSSLGMIIVFQFNFWMTGEFFRSPLYFSDENFKSLDYSARFLNLLLFDKTAGMFSVHPVLLLGILASISLVFVNKTVMYEKIFFFSFFICVCLQIWMISGFYAWSGGGWIYGSRYMNPISIGCSLAIIKLLHVSNRSTVKMLGILGLSVACSLYSFRILTSYELIFWILCFLFVTILTLLLKTNSFFNFNLIEKLFCIFGFLLLGFCFNLYLERAISDYIQINEILKFIFIMVFLFIFFVLFFTEFSIFNIGSRLFGGPVIKFFFPVLLITQFIMILNLKFKSVEYQASQLINPSAQYQYINNFHMQNLEIDVTSNSVYKWPKDYEQNIIDFYLRERDKSKIRR